MEIDRHRTRQDRAYSPLAGHPQHTAGALVLALVLAACGEPTPAETAVAQAASSPALAPPGDTITLITGDRVTVRSIAGRRVPWIQRGPGRDQIAFSQRDDDGELTVLPSDVLAQVGTGQLDPALFNVTRLLAEGYGDDRRDDLPLVITGAASPAAPRNQAASAGVIVDRTMPALHALAVRQRKASPGAVLAQLSIPAAPAAPAAPTTGSAPASSAAPTTRIWLDRRCELVLDRSVPQIGAPAAYARGLTGAGVVVAVLDSGIDTTHPDLAGKVVAEEDFVGDGLGTSDAFGHGTHVASIIAGTGAASAGRFHGVAPDAALVNGRVCGQFGGCFTSAILAGMEWAVVTQHARIVNLSLGGRDQPGIDPLEDAVNQLSAQFGALFVIAAGNAGPGAGTVQSPGSADAALTVGAVDRGDQLAAFSSRGPRIADHAIKPEITGPGVGIVAARAAGTQLGPPVGDRYVAVSGTSMATPHVAGAAAIVLQQHPEWTGDQIKAALVGAAQPTPALTVYEQGAGRVDVDRVTRQGVTAEPASLSLGIARFPHDDDPPLVRTVRYRNTGSAPVVLAIDAALTAPGVAAPRGMVAVSPSSVTVPPGGAADATVTIDTRVDGPDKLYGGAVTATGDGVRIVTPIGVEREVESYDLTLDVRGLVGEDALGFVSLFGVAPADDPAHDTKIRDQVVMGQATFRVPKGTYLVDTLAFSDSFAWLIAPRQPVPGDTTLVADMRLGRPLDLTFPDPSVTVADAEYAYQDDASGAAIGLFALPGTTTAQLGASPAPGAFLSLAQVLAATAPLQPATVYHLAHVERDRFLTGWQQTIRRRDLATVHARHAGPGDHVLFKPAFALVPHPRTAGGAGFNYTGPFQTTEYYFGDGVQWVTEVEEETPDPSIPGFFTVLAQQDQARDYRPGQHYLESWNQAPYAPAFCGPSLNSALFQISNTPQRTGDSLVLAPSPLADQAIPARGSISLADQGRLTLRRDGAVVAETTDPFDLVLQPTVPAATSQYRLEAELTRSQDMFDLSTHVVAAWTFRSQHADGTQVLPLPTPRFFPPLDDHNATASPVLVLPIRIERPAGAAAPRITGARVEVSFDDGATWRPVPIVRDGDTALGIVVHPPGATHASLRGSASDVAGNQGDVTIVRAYAITPRR